MNLPKKKVMGNMGESFAFEKKEKSRNLGYLEAILRVLELIFGRRVLNTPSYFK